MRTQYPKRGRTRRADYSLGLLLSLLLMVAAFGAVLSDALPHALRLPAIGALCAAHLLVLLGYFVRIGSGPNHGDKTVVVLCTALLIALLAAGSWWMMQQAAQPMAPMTTSVQAARAGA